MCGSVSSLCSEAFSSLWLFVSHAGTGDLGRELGEEERQLNDDFSPAKSANPRVLW